ncbi:beta-glucosidase [Halocella sp. SP3-1]|nr:beta-glucosidase [Halocella sp. SP3-1]
MVVFLCFMSLTGAVQNGLTLNYVQGKDNNISEVKLDFINDKSLSIEEKVNKLIDLMTLEEKIGQMTQAERDAVNVGDIKNYYLGSILSGGGSVPYPNEASNWVEMYNNFQKEAMNSRLRIPILYGIDAVHGHNSVKNATIFPHNIGIGATRDSKLVKKIAKITAVEVRATGLDLNFSPSVAVARDERWGRTYESFGETSELQELLTAAYIKGLQGEDTEMGGEYVIATAKHYLGDGGVELGTGQDGLLDRGDVSVSEEVLRGIHMQGYLKAIDAGVGCIMVSHSSWQGTKMHAQQYLITDVLKEELGFDGIVLSDWNSIHDIKLPSYYEQVVKSVNAGIDMFMEPYDWKRFISTLKEAVVSGDISEDRINDAVSRILTIKFKAGKFAEPFIDPKQVDFNVIGSSEHREAAREAVRKSLVLLKNKNGVLPISRSANIYLAGSNCDDIGSQCGGWTLSWQGSTGDITEGTTIKEGIKNAVKGRGKVVASLDNADIAIVVIGENPYAEWKGDDPDLSLSKADITTLNKVKQAGIPIVVVMVSGRPLIVSNYIDDWDAFIEAWLPGSEGQGVADVIFGDYNFTGRLPITWPKHVSQLPINYGDRQYDPLFEYGYGLVMDL